MAEEALTCFKSLLGIVPSLLDELDGILKSSRERQRQELTKNQPARGSGPALKRDSRSSSLQSKPSAENRPTRPTQAREADDARATAYELPSTHDPRAADAPPMRLPSLQDAPQAVKEQLPHLTDADALRLAQRKRKTASACSDRHSGSIRYRSRHLVVVYYDGEVQRRFEAVVRRIGMCRNSMRKGKMSAKVDALSRTGSSSSDDSQDEGLMGTVKINGATPTLRRPKILPRNDGMQAFDKADGFLDKAQALCERAAHQILRDGDCAAEVKSAKEHILSAQKVGEEELPALQKRAEKAEERRRREEEQEEQEEQRAPARKQDKYTEDKHSHVDSRLGSPAAMPLEVDDLEVDESEDDSDMLLHTITMGKFNARTAATFNRYLQTA